jgi:hypothetical protein
MPDNPELTAAIAAWNALDAAISDVDRLARTLRQKLGAVVTHQAIANDRMFPHSFTTLGKNENEYRWWWGYGKEPEAYEADFPTREAVIAALPQDRPGHRFTVCEARRMPLCDGFFDAEWLLEQWHEHNTEAQDEDGDLQMEPTPTQRMELERDLAAAFAAWRIRHRLGRAWNLELRHSEIVTPCPEAKS